MSASPYTSSVQESIISAGLNAFLAFTLWFILELYTSILVKNVISSYPKIVSEPDGYQCYLVVIYLLRYFNWSQLIWRCYNIWSRSLRAILLPSFLLICEIGLDDLGTSPSQVDTLNTVLGVATFMTLATTLVATLLISYRIHSVAKQDLPRSSRSRFNHIIEILVQSAAVYSVVTLASAITVVVPLTENNVAQVFTAETYVSAIYAFTSGIVPTVMVARVVLADDTNRDMNISVITRVSGLQFHGQSASTPNSTQFSRRDQGVHVETSNPDLVLEEREKIVTKE
ncbi:hypothetical protein CPB84DRAFT_1825940 [Gymnopilus junonius]|uniref:Uncharacterized protein n=1 Tax=Gymnopilus junonius TaxID=109634 RepID=A0A9P5NI10_GYMJU|nr:hypothetical protein CPB84DRAFT_1825940 [Gymnopilus junonius]